MKKTIAVCIMLLFLGSPALAHPPASISGIYYMASKTACIVINHPVRDSRNHFINRIDIIVNGREMMTQRFSMQDNDQTQYISAYIPHIDTGDSVTIKAYCSVSGTLTHAIAIQP